MTDATYLRTFGPRTSVLDLTRQIEELHKTSEKLDGAIARWNESDSEIAFEVVCGLTAHRAELADFVTKLTESRDDLAGHVQALAKS